MEDPSTKIKAVKEKKRIVDAIHSTEKKIDFLEKEIINAIGLSNGGVANFQHVGTIASLIHELQAQNSNKNNKPSIELSFNLPVERDDNFELFDRVACNKKIANEKKNLFKKQQQIKNSVSNFIEVVKRKENSLNYLENLKSLMEAIESNIVLFKESQKNTYEELLITEKRLTQELSIFQEHLNDWEEKKSNKDWLVGRNSYTHGMLLRKKSVNSQSSAYSVASSSGASNSNSVSKPEFIPPEVSLEAKSIMKYGYTEGKKKFISMLSNNESFSDMEDENITSLDLEEEDIDNLDHEENINSLTGGNSINFKKYMKHDSNKFSELLMKNSNSVKNSNNDGNSDNNIKNNINNKNSIKSSLLSDIERFRNFYIRNHGRNGGWDELSHSMFEKIWKKIGPNNSRFKQTCLDSIPGLDYIALEKHIEWYETYQELLKKKKSAIENWKSENMRKRIEIQKNLNINPSHIELEIKNKMAKEKKRKEKEQRQKIKQKLKVWKEKKKLEEEKENYIAEEEKRKEKELEDKKLQIKQKINKEKLKAYNEEKKKLESKKEKGNNNKKELDIHSRQRRKMDLKYFQEKDKNYLKQKLQRKLKNQQEESNKELRLEKIRSVHTIIVDRDPNRILQPTKTFQNYINSVHRHSSTNSIFSSTENVNAFFHPNEFQHRAIPMWRKGLV